MRFFGHETRHMFRRTSLAGRRSILALVIVAGSIAVLPAASGYVPGRGHTAGPGDHNCDRVLGRCRAR